MGKYIKRSKKKFTRKISLKDIIAGAFSPNTASIKLQSLARRRIYTQTKKRESLKNLLSQGSEKYKKALHKLDFRGINLDNQILSRRVLDNGNFEKVSFDNAKLNGCKLNNVNFRGARFPDTGMKNITANNSNFEKCGFHSANISRSQFKDSNFKKAFFTLGSLYHSTFIECNFQDTKFLTINLSDSTFKKCNLKNVKIFFVELDSLLIENLSFEDSMIDNVNITNNLNILKSFYNVDRLINKLTLNADKLEGVINLLIEDKIFQDCEFNQIILKESKFIRCQFNNCNFLSNVALYKTTLQECIFINCKFAKKFKGHSNIYIKTIFRNSSLEEYDFRSTVIQDVEFINCNLNNSNFSGSIFKNTIFKSNSSLFQCNMTQCDFNNSIIFSQDTNLQEVDFQSSKNLENTNFDGINMQATRLTGVILNGSTFRETNLRGVQFDFSEIYGCNFTGANLQNANVNIAEGRYEAIGIPDDQADLAAVDTHKTFYSININALVDFYKKYSEIDMSQKYSNNDILIDDTLKKFRAIVSNSNFSTKERIEILEGLMKCYQGRLDTFDFERIIAGTEPRIIFRDLIYTAIKYLEKQPKEFKELYLQFFIYDSTNAHGQGGLSCAPGIVERIITIMSQAAAPLKDSIPAKSEEYQELINIISNDPYALMVIYNQEWFDYHRDSKNPFPEDAPPDVIINDFIKFMKMKFKYDEQNGTQKKKLEKVIMEHDLVGVEKLKEMIEGEYLFFAEGLLNESQKKLKKFKPLNLFKLLRNRFDFKYIKSKDKKNKKNKKNKSKKAGNVNRANRSRSALLQKNINHLITLKKEERLRRSRKIRSKKRRSRKMR